MAPEQLRGQIAQAPSDVWAFGVMLYEMSTGRRPFSGQTRFELSAAILNEPAPALPPSIPAPLQAVIARCLEKEQVQRYKSAGEIRAALDVIQTAGDLPRVSTAVEPIVTTPAPDSLSITIPGLTRRRALWIGVAAALATAIGFGAWRWWHPVADTRMLAVLPFENVSKEPELDYLCEGVADSLIKQVAKLKQFRVRNLSSALNAKAQAADPVSAGRLLGVDTILSGTLELRDQRMVISARLFDVTTGRELWKNTYDREIARDAPTVLNIQDEISGSMMNDGLRLKLTTDERQQLVRRITSSGEAYDLYLQARHLQRRADEDSYLQARELLKKAVTIDPKFALAFTHLSGIYAMMVTDGLERPTDAWPQATKFMKEAQKIDPDIHEAIALEHAVEFLFYWDWEAAAASRKRVLAGPIGDLDPHFLRAMAVEFWALGQPDEALRVARRTRELDPLNLYLAVLEADYLLRAGQLDAAAALYEEAIRRDPTNLNSYFGLAEVRYRQRRFDEAISLRRQVHTAAGDDQLKDVLAAARGEQGYRQIERAWVRVQLEDLKARQATKYVSPLDFARVHAQLGEKEQAFEYMERAFIDRSPGLVFLKVDPAWEAVRSDPRFAVAIKRVGLPQF
jgi:TolB-like protein/Tfp pilus assembly protein PilF